MGRRGCAGWRGIKGEKWENCNSIINKIYFKKRIEKTKITKIRNKRVDITTDPRET